MSAAMLCAATFAITSVIWPVFGTPAGTGVGSGGAIAICDPGSEHVSVLRMAVLVVDRDEPHRVRQSLGLAYDVDTGERRHDHRVGERQDATAFEFDLAAREPP